MLVDVYVGTCVQIRHKFITLHIFIPKASFSYDNTESNIIYAPFYENQNSFCKFKLDAW